MTKLVPRNLRDGQLTIKDNGGTNSITLNMERGDLSWTETQDVQTILDRGSLRELRAGDDQPVEVSFTLIYDELISSAGDETPYEALRQSDRASSWVSTRSTTEIFCVDLDFLLTDPTGTQNEQVTFNDFYVESIEFSEGDEASELSVSGKAFRTRVTRAKV